MLQIEIIEGFPDGTLALTNNGRPSNGNSHASRREDVHWKVKPHCGVASIDNIIMKADPSSSDIFSDEPPARQIDDPVKHWKGKVNRNAKFFSEYNYSIFWAADDGSAREYDPKIAVKPSPAIPFAKEFVSVVSLLAFFYLIFFRRRKK